MGGISGPGIAGVAKAFTDTERLRQQDERHGLEKQRLEADAADRPLRTRALEIGIENAEYQQGRQETVDARTDELGAIQLDLARLTKTEREAASKELTEATTRNKRLNEGMRQFVASQDPQHLADALAELYPEQYTGATAVRNVDGSITTAWGDGQTHTYKGRTWEDGSVMTPDDELGMLATQILNPLEVFKTKWGHAMKSDIEGLKTDRATSVAEIRAGASGNAATATWYDRQHRQIKPTLDSILKTTGVAGSFIAGYAHTNDAALRGKIEERVDMMLSAAESSGKRVTARQVASDVIDDVRKSYDVLDKQARMHAEALAKKKIKPTDPAAVEKAAQQGDPDAKRLLHALQTAEKHLGYSVRKYLQDQLPAVR